MNHVFKAVLSHPQHPEYGQVTISFPIPNGQYDQMIKMLQGIDLGFSVNRDCKVNEVDSPCSVLNALKGTLVNVDQLDYLAKRMDSFSPAETSQFQAMAYKLNLCDIKDLINLTFCSQKTTVVANFSDLEKVGKDHLAALNGGAPPPEQLQGANSKKEALQLIQSGLGTVTPYGVVYDNGMELEQRYNGRQFPLYPYDSRLMVLEVAPERGLSEGKNPEYFYLPVPEEQIERTLLRAGIHSLSSAKMRLVFDELPEKVAESLDLEHLAGGAFPALNQMCAAVEPLSDADAEKLCGAIMMAEAHGADEILRLAENLDQFDFTPGISTPEEYGRFLIQRSGQFQYDESLERYYDYAQYGLQRVREEQGQFNDFGYIAYRGVLTLEELVRRDPAEQLQQDQGPQLGGLSRAL